MSLVEDVYVVTRGFPSDERFGLTSQLRRAAVSIPSNIGEGARRRRLSSFCYFLQVALARKASWTCNSRSRIDSGTVHWKSISD